MNPEAASSEPDDLGLSLSLTRVTQDDSQRTRLLKESLRRVMDLHEKAQKDMPKPQPKKMAGPPPKRKGFSSNLPPEVKAMPNPMLVAAEGLEELQMSVAGGITGDRLDDLCA